MFGSLFNMFCSFFLYSIRFVLSLFKKYVLFFLCSRNVFGSLFNMFCSFFPIQHVLFFLFECVWFVYFVLLSPFFIVLTLHSGER